MERPLSLPQAAGDLLDDAASQNHWEAVVSGLGAQISFRSLVALAVIAVITLVSVVCAALTIKTDDERFLVGSAVALASAFLVMIIWRSAPHQSSLAPLLGKPVEPPARIRIFQTALATGKIEAGRGIDPSLFEGALWPLLFSRTKAHRRHVRARDGHRELNLLTIDRDAFDAWRRSHGWIETASSFETAATANSRTVDEPRTPRKKSF